MRRISYLKFREGVDQRRIAAFEDALARTPEHVPGVVGVWFGVNVIPRWPEQAYIIEMQFKSRKDAEAFPRSEYYRERLARFFNAEAGIAEWIESVYYEPMRLVVPQPEIRQCLKRSLIVGVEEGTAPEEVERFERQIMEMPAHIPAIRNWAFGRVDQGLEPTRWTHVWEFEMQDAKGFQAYMESPFHWGVVDRWFDPEWTGRILVPQYLHGYFQTASSVLACR